ncbi:MAG TPA: 50S ribosomal protein L35 [Acholeplasmataceae bacterium]|jgi:large subunit ribosomal protein L35|nr:50S ribosomal protein L35 [Acholeplasmataceae bacterium]
MPKMKTHRATKKRIKITGSGLVMRGRPGNSHLAPGKTQKRIRHLRKESTVSPADMKRIKKQVANIK